MCRIISLLEHYFLLLITFCNYFLKCTNLKKYIYQTDFLLIFAFLILLVKKALPEDTPGLLSSREMPICTISFHNNTFHSWTPKNNNMGTIRKKNKLTSRAFATHSLLSLSRIHTKVQRHVHCTEYVLTITQLIIEPGKSIWRKTKVNSMLCFLKIERGKFTRQQ